MSYGQWMVPQLSLAAEAQLQHSVKTLQAHGATNIQDTVALACSLVQQNAIQQAILRQATAHIAELELELLLGSRKRPTNPWKRLSQYVARKLGRVGQ